MATDPRRRCAPAVPAECAIRDADRHGGYSAREGHAVSTFYLLPSRPFLGERLAAALRSFFPGLDWNRPRWTELADAIGQNVVERPDVFLVYRDELPASEDPVTALTDGYGAVTGDEVIEIQSGAT